MKIKIKRKNILLQDVLTKTSIGDLKKRTLSYFVGLNANFSYIYIYIALTMIFSIKNGKLWSSRPGAVVNESD